MAGAAEATGGGSLGSREVREAERQLLNATSAPSLAPQNPGGLSERSPAEGVAEERALFLATAPARRSHYRAAVAAIATSTIAFIISLPFATTPLAPLPAFIPIYQATIVANNLITAMLLYGQFSMLSRFGIWRSHAMLVLAAAYLFAACLTTAHTMSFPGLFSPTGLLGAGPQTTAWLYMFWHGGFSLTIIVYTLIRDSGVDGDGKRSDPPRLGVSVGVAVAGAAALTLLATVGHDALPAIMQGQRYTSAMATVVSTVLAISLLALLAVWHRRSYTVLDVWLVVVMYAWVLDIALSAVFNSGRYDLGFYTGRLYGLIATSFVLAMLLFESNTLYARLVESHQSERRKAIELRRLSTLDPLTGIANRRAFDEALDEEWRRTLRHGSPLCLIMIDVDYFKRFNDTYGHVAGDECLRAVARVLADNTRRAGEMAARYGGEEFAVLLPHARLEEAHGLAERICQDVRELGIPHSESTAADCVTVSMGLADALALLPAGATHQADGRGKASAASICKSLLVERADSALYRAKTGGRNQVAIAGGDRATSPETRQSAA